MIIAFKNCKAVSMAQGYRRVWVKVLAKMWLVGVEKLAFLLCVTPFPSVEVTAQ